jgi:hypothetical protein
MQNIRNLILVPITLLFALILSEIGICKKEEDVENTSQIELEIQAMLQSTK